jgi:hypothetical protein
VHQRFDLDKEQRVEMGQSSHISHIFAPNAWEGCALFPQNQEERVSCSDRGLSSPPSYLFGASSKPFFPHVALSHRHGESNTCQIVDQTTS